MKLLLYVLALLPLVNRGLCAAPLAEREASIVSPWVWGQKLKAKTLFVKEKESDFRKESPKTPTNKRPFLPFSQVGASAGPLPREDGTTKSRIVQDTLPGDTFINGLEDDYTTLDVIQQVTKPGREYPVHIKGSLGGLDPREVYYADDDLLIIKGGGFESPSYQEPSQEIEDGNEVDDNDWGLRRLPSFQEEYNGNIPSILAPPPNYSYWSTSDPSAATQFSPLALFLPANVLMNGESSNVNYAFAAAPQIVSDEIKEPNSRSIQSPNYRYLRVFPSGHFVTKDYFTTYDSRRAADSTMNAPVKTDYNTGINSYIKQFAPQSNDKYRQAALIQSIQPSGHYIEGYRARPIWPTTQNRLSYANWPVASMGEVLPVPRYLSLRDDTRVNYLQPRPPINPDAEIIPLLRPKKRPAIISFTSPKLYSTNRQRPKFYPSEFSTTDQRTNPRSPPIPFRESYQPITGQVQRVPHLK